MRSRRGCRGRCPTRYEVRLGVELADRPAREARTERGWDPGGRRSLTSDQGDTVVVAKRDATRTRRLRRAVARCRKGSRGYRKAQAKLRCHLADETRAREQHRRKQVAHAARKAELHVVEENRHQAMRRAGGAAKTRMNRSLAEARPAKTAQLLAHACRKTGRQLATIPGYSPAPPLVASSSPFETSARLRTVKLCRKSGAPRYKIDILSQTYQ